MKFYIQALFSLLLIIGISSTYAANAPINIRALENSDTTISLDWEDVSDAVGYYLYYGTTSGSGTNYEVELVDMIEESEYVIGNLLAETSYYIALTTIDDFGTESSYSSEIQHTTLANGAESEATSFRIQDVEIIDAATLELYFTKNLNTSETAEQVFIIEEKESGVELVIDISQVNEDNTKNVLVLLGSDLQEDTEYRISVLDINDEQGNTIESGIDAFIEFQTPASFEIEVIINEDPVDMQENQDINSNEEDNTQEDESLVINLESAGPSGENIEIDTATEANTNNNAGENVSQDDIDANTTQTAQDNTKLPQTGAEHWLLLIFSLSIAAGGYILFNRKTILKK